jgi:serine/threonine protein kinase
MGQATPQLPGGTDTYCLGIQRHPARHGGVLCQHCGAFIVGASLHQGAYQVHQLLGRGRIGSTYLASHVGSGQTVAVKLIPRDPDHTAWWEYLRREVRLITSLQHRNIAQVYRCSPWSPELERQPRFPFQTGVLSFNQEGFLLALCQYVPTSLALMLAEASNNPPTSLSQEQTAARITWLLPIIQQIGSAFVAAHELGVPHGAPTPGNILLGKQDQVFVADFGFARLRVPPDAYCAPELQSAILVSQQQGTLAPFWQATTVSTDQYALGVLFRATCSQILPESAYHSWLPVLDRATHALPRMRFGSVAEFVEELLFVASRRGAQAEPSHPRITSTQGWAADEPSETSSSAPASTAEQVAKSWEKLAGQAYLRGNYSEALKGYQRALEFDGNNAALLLALGDTFFALGRHADALAAYDRVLRLNPRDGQAWSNKGVVLDAMGRSREAEHCHEQARILGG